MPRVVQQKHQKRQSKSDLSQQKEQTSTTLRQFVCLIAEKEKVSAEQVEKIIVKSFRRSYCRGENSEADLSFEINDGLTVLRNYRITKQVTDISKEISPDNPLLKEGRISGDIFSLPVDVVNFSFSLSQEISLQIRKELQDITRQNQLQIFKEKKNQLVKGKVRSLISDFCVIDLEGNNVGYWPKKEWHNIVRPYLGQRFYFLINSIEEKGDVNFDLVNDKSGEEERSFRIFLNRDSSYFLQKVAELIIPEVKDGTILIKHIIRAPGLLSKIIVQSTVPKLDPLGAFIGQDAVRIRSIRTYVYYPDERVEIACWSEDKRQLLFNLLSPAKVVSLVEKNDSWEVMIPNGQLFSMIKNRPQLLESVSEYLQKKINLVDFEGAESKGSRVIIWNGNIDFEEYQKLIDEGYSSN